MDIEDSEAAPADEVDEGLTDPALRESVNQTEESRKQTKIAILGLAIAVLAILIPTVRGIDGSSDNGKPVPPERTEGATSAPYESPVETELDRFSVPRFGFWYSAPVSWTRSDPTNGDGTLWTDPRIDEQVEIRVSGAYDIMDSDEGDLEGLLTEFQGDDEQLIDSRQAGGYSVSLDSKTGRQTRSELPGWRITTTYTNWSGDSVMDVRQMILAGRRFVTFQGVAPTSLFPRYEALFSKVAASITIDGDWTG